VAAAFSLRKTAPAHLFGRVVKLGRHCGQARQVTVLRAQNCRPARKARRKNKIFLFSLQPVVAAQPTAPSYRFARENGTTARKGGGAVRARR